MIEIDQHDDPGLRRHAGQRDEPDRHRDRPVVAEQPDEPDPAHQRERQREHHDQRLADAPEVEVEQQEDDRQRRRDRRAAASPRRAACTRTGRSTRACSPAAASTSLATIALRLGDVAADVPAGDVHVDPRGRHARPRCAPPSDRRPGGSSRPGRAGRTPRARAADRPPPMRHAAHRRGRAACADVRGRPESAPTRAAPVCRAAPADSGPARRSAPAPRPSG